MILKGNQRAGGKQLALHLMNEETNDHVTWLEVSGFATEDPIEAMEEAHAMCKATRAKKYIYSLSLNPPAEFDGDIAKLERAVDDAEDRLGLSGQPRMVVLHEKESRIHAHAAWSLINAEEMKKIKIYRDHDKLNELSKEKFLEHDWKLPDGFKNKDLKNPLNFSRAEWQQALRTGQSAKDIKQNLQECWSTSDSKKAFENALHDRGFVLAKGDRRSYVAVDLFGEVYSLPRQLGKKAKDLEPRLGKSEELQSVEQAKSQIAGRLTKRFRVQRDELTRKHTLEKRPLLQAKRSLVETQRQERSEQNEQHKKRWAQEELKRSMRLRKGFKGLWDRLTGSYQKTRKRNERETHKCELRDKREKQNLMKSHLENRQKLQVRITAIKEKHKAENFALLRGAHQHFKKLDRDQELRKLFEKQKREKQQRLEQKKDQGPNFEPEI